ncbi:MAG: CPBP family intramembrane metalloprotease [Bacteroidales bacterium]|nr:CPBP family intramembrane metalloprotease [Bacteroidales bacterium]
MNIKTAPLWQWILMVMAAIFLGLTGYGLVVAATEATHSSVVALLAPLVLIALYVLVVRWFEKEWAPDILTKNAVWHLLLGLAVGVVYFILVVGIMWLCGCCSIQQLSWDWNAQIKAFLMFLGVAVGEEVLFRGVVFKWIDKRWGLWVALIVSGLIFGFVHLTNDNATIWSSLAISIEAGLLLGAAYKWSGSLWLPIGIHWTWNYTQGNIFGFAVSGTDAGTSWLRVVPDGPDILTGGAFGAEASIISVLLGLALTALFVWAYLKRK